MAAKQPGDPSAPRTRRPSLSKLGRDADAGNESAMYQLMDHAAEHGIDPDDHPTWTGLAEHIAEKIKPATAKGLDVEVVEPRAQAKAESPARAEPPARA